MTSQPSQDDFISFQGKIVDSGVWRCCLNCLHWGTNDVEKRVLGNHIAADGSPIQPQCNRFKALPPPTTLILSCREWQHIIPF